MNMKQEFIREIASIETTEEARNQYKGICSGYVWDEDWSDQLNEKYGAVRITKDKQGYINFHFLNRETVEEAKVIRRALRKMCREAQVPAFSVRKDRGTASGWLNIRVMGGHRMFNYVEDKVLESFELRAGGYCELINPESTDYYAQLALEILGEDGRQL